MKANHWDHNYIVQIRKKKDAQRSEDLQHSLKLISQRLYSEKTHFILELVQNASGAGASEGTG